MAGSVVNGIFEAHFRAKYRIAATQRAIEGIGRTITGSFNYEHKFARRDHTFYAIENAKMNSAPGTFGLLVKLKLD